MESLRKRGDPPERLWESVSHRRGVPNEGPIRRKAQVLGRVCE